MQRFPQTHPAPLRRNEVDWPRTSNAPRADTGGTRLRLALRQRIPGRTLWFHSELNIGDAYEVGNPTGD
jgi:hypothetical protein